MARHRKIPELLQRFLNEIHVFHEGFEFTDDYKSIADFLNVAFSFARENISTRVGNQGIITVDIDSPETRKAFTAWHEICHELFRRSKAEDAVSLEDDVLDCCQFANQNAVQVEEEFCNSGASVLLFPHHILRQVQIHGYGPIAAMKLLESRQGSLEAAARRIAYHHGYEAYVYLIESSGHVIDSFGVAAQYNTSKKYYTLIASLHAVCNRQREQRSMSFDLKTIPCPSM